jgi:hypothetical protein
MDLMRLVIATPAEPTADAVAPGRFGGVDGNARLTATVGAALFVILAIEGITILQIHQLISWHVFLGMLLVPVVLLKSATTGYRFSRYYTGDPPYAEKGPPPLVLRVTGPALVLTTLALLGTGIALIALGRGTGNSYLWLHQATFFVWAALLAVHVLGHAQETLTLSAADWRARRVATLRRGGARVRAVAVAVTLAVGAVLGYLSISWVGTWHHFHHFGHG